VSPGAKTRKQKKRKIRDDCKFSENQDIKPRSSGDDKKSGNKAPAAKNGHNITKHRKTENKRESKAKGECVEDQTSKHKTNNAKRDVYVRKPSDFDTPNGFVDPF